jgi:hypothetical protein
VNLVSYRGGYGYGYDYVGDTWSWGGLRRYSRRSPLGSRKEG